MRIQITVILVLLVFAGCSGDQASRKEIRFSQNLNESWFTSFADSSDFYAEFEKNEFNITAWNEVDVPHNWDDYGGYRRLRHGNLHGTAWYRKTFSLENPDPAKQYFLFFEGVGSYATIWLNGDSVGYHAGGRTTFTLDITPFVKLDGENLLAVRADHPADIRDLPWVCGGCSPEWGFCEGSQPLGIFRPVTLIATDPVRLEPFGVHIWNDSTILSGKATLNLITEVRNYGSENKIIQLKNILIDAGGKQITSTETEIELDAKNQQVIQQQIEDITNPHLWSIEDPYLYTVRTEILQNEKVIDRIETHYGIRSLKWDIFGENASNRFYLNGEPVFINGTAEYEHMMGQGHAFSDEQVKARTKQVKAMGFNSFRDGHQPHNLRYQEVWDESGLLWWPQMTAHIWFDNPEFRRNFKTLLTDWIKERRNSPSVILWGLENESTLPEDFAQECTDLIRKLDPTASSQRLVTTCNGGTGTDWNVVQNWSGTYGGNPDNYANELSEQLLNGEYGAWRSLDLHTEGEFDQNGIYSEDRMNLLMESKIRLGEEAADKSCGQYHWLMASHDNPGRTQSGEGMRDIDRIGPVNYKGALTVWGEPLDLFYMFRSNYAPKESEPMVYIVSHTWPDRWTEPGIKYGIRIFTNCDEVELFNGVKENSLGRKKRGPLGTHIVFDNVNVQNNLLYAVGYVDGKTVAEDQVLLHHLPEDPGLHKLSGETLPLTENGRNYIYRVNCGGDEYTDQQGNLWMADVHQTDPGTWGSRSWTDDYNGMPAFYGSQRQTHDPISGTYDWPLIQSFRYGRHKLSYNFPLPDGKYKVEFFFTEPWYGTGGGLNCTNWRVFDVAINDKVVIDDLDIWAEVGHDRLLKKTVEAEIEGGELKISFPQVESGQAVISAIAVSSEDKDIQPAPAASGVISKLNTKNNAWSAKKWMDTGIDQYSDAKGRFAQLAPELYGAEWIKTPSILKSGEQIPSFEITAESDVWIGIDTTLSNLPDWLNDWKPLDKYVESTFEGRTDYQIYQKRFKKRAEVQLKRFAEDDFEMYPIAVLPVTNLDDPIDLRTSTRWEAEDGKLYGSARKVNHLDKVCVMTSGETGTIGPEFAVGLASKYGLEFRYINLSGSELKADIQILAADGREMWAGEWTFLPTPNQWKSFRTDTQTTINAGTYTIKITPKSNGPLYLDWVKVQ
ncbi:malectin domain-containing carbohydrate-binding protein [Maribellus sediminis]|uniref:malectin domain-containing carbohydrate-binding protein n=1 Tax=Maribellus sediminis TaxID=2696285 RepID=UPI00197F4084|nr:malectin domain-containing carbohydrate-binding protein [Maribellus sediminis]